MSASPPLDLLPYPEDMSLSDSITVMGDSFFLAVEELTATSSRERARSQETAADRNSSYRKAFIRGEKTHTKLRGWGRKLEPSFFLRAGSF